MSAPEGTSLTTADGTLTTPIPPPEDPEPAAPTTPTLWLRENLFSSWWSTVLTVLALPVLAYLAYRAVRFVFVTGEWEVVRANLRLFMVGQFPADQVWRLWVAAGVLAVTIGLANALRIVRQRELGEDEGIPELRTWRDRVDALRPVGPALVGLVAVLSLTRTATPALLSLAVIALYVAARVLGARLHARPDEARWLRPVVLAWVAAVVIRVVAGQVGADGLTDAVDPVVFWGLQAVVAPLLLVYGLVLGRPSLVVTPGIIWAYTVIVAFGGRPVATFGGFLLTLVVALAGIVLAFPFGVALALARRSSFPALRVVSVGFIELIRGVPLITLLFMAFLAFGLLLPPGTGNPSLIVRSIVVIAMFTAAYVAEIVRGGLQSVPRGQVEAGQAIGLTPLKVTRLIVLPQALRAVIPALVGQFISIFKDTSLLTIIGVTELLGFVDVVLNQPEFLGASSAEPYVFVAFIYWVSTYSMSRYSQRLETRLGVGTR